MNKELNIQDRYLHDIESNASIYTNNNKRYGVVTNFDFYIHRRRPSFRSHKVLFDQGRDDLLNHNMKELGLL